MDFISSIQLDPIYSPQLSYLLIIFIIYYLGHFLEGILEHRKREKTTIEQRDLYYQRLFEESMKMEEENFKEELKLAQDIEELKQEGEGIKEQLAEYQNDDSDDWSIDERLTEHSRLSESDKILQLNEELEDLKSKSQELQYVENEISKMAKDLEINNVEGKSEDEFTNSLQQLANKIEELETENKELNSQIKNYQGLTVSRKESKLDPELIEYLEEHNEELTLEFLEKVYETLLELKASDPTKAKRFDEYIEELKESQSRYVTEIAELRVSRKEVEIKFEMVKQQYQDELKSFDELRVEHIFKNSGAKEYLERLKDKNKIADERIESLKVELESKKKEMKVWQDKFLEAEKQCGIYYQAMKNTQVRYEQLEAERQASQELERRLNMNMSSASSLVDNMVPPPPPINVSIDELLRSSSMVSQHSHQSNQPRNQSLNTSIPPPPPAEVPSFNRY